MRRAPRSGFALAAVLVAAVIVVPRIAAAQSTPPATQKLPLPEIVALAKVQAAIGQDRDSMQAQLAMAKNKTNQAQQALRDKLQDQITEILHHAGMTEAEYQKKSFAVSADPDNRKTFDSVLVAITGVPTPGQVQANAGRGGGRGAAGAAAQVAVPAGAVGTHIGHVVNGFSDTPMGMGLLPTATAEATIAAQHATLASRNATSLDAMKLHAGHVINAIDPTIVPMGPGLGYGVKKAATGVATHIELAAKAAGASPNVVMHSVHVATAARSTVACADKVVAVAQKIQAATTVAEAAALVSQLVSLTAQLTSGFDANSDGQITWEAGEGGLQQAGDHVTLMLKAEGLGGH